MAQSSPGRTITLSGVPPGCKLINVKTTLEEILKRKGSVSHIKWFRNQDSSIIPGKCSIELETAEDAATLLDEVVINFESNDDLYTLRLTRSRPSIDTSASFHQHRPVPHDSKATPLQSTSSSSKEKIHGSNLSSGFGKFGREKSWAICSSNFDDTSSISSLEDDGEADNQQYAKRDMETNSSATRGLRQEEYGASSKSFEVVKLTNHTFNWFELLQEKPELFEKYRENCILVQCALDDIGVEELTAYFQKVLHSSVDCVKEMSRLADGILVTFDSRRAAEAVITKGDQNIGKLKLKVFRKPIPPVYDDRVLLKGNFAGLSKDEIADVIDCFTTAKFKVQKHRGSGMFLVIFEEAVDIDSMDRKRETLSLSSMNLKIVKVCRTDCIKVENVKKGTSVDKVKLALMNRKLNEGDITLVQQQPLNNVTLVYFADYQDAEKLVDKSKRIEVSVAKQPVEVSLFCPGIKGSLEYSSCAVYPFRYTLDEDKDIIQFIKNSANILRDFYKELGHLADVEFIENTNDGKADAKVKPVLSEAQSQELEQENFENDCRSRIRKFCSKFITKCEKFPDEDRDRVRKDFHWNNGEELLEEEIKKNYTVKVFVRWEERDGRVKVVGTPKDVNSFLEFFQGKCNFVQEVEAFTDTDFEILLHCGIVDETNSYFQGSLTTDLDKIHHTLTFSGPKEIVSAAKASLKNNLKSIGETDISYLSPVKQKFLETSLQGSDASLQRMDVLDFLREKMHENKIKVYLQRQEYTLKIFYPSKKREELEKAQVKIDNVIKCKTIPCANGFDTLMHEKSWERLKESIVASGTLLVFKNMKSSAVQVVGLPLSFRQECERIVAYFAENIEEETRVPLPFAETVFICEFPGDIGVEENLKELEYYKEPGGIHLKGRAKLVRKAEQWLVEVSKIVQTETKKMQEPGMAEFLRSKGGEQFLKTTSKNTHCVIQLDKPAPNEWDEAAMLMERQSADTYSKENTHFNTHEPTTGPQRSVFEEAKFKVKSFFGLSDNSSAPTSQQDLNVTVSVVNGDILKSTCDVIINTVGSQYDLTASQLSAKLISLAGQQMVKECDNNPVLDVPNMFRVTSAPNLPFKNVIHLITPDTSGKIPPILKEALTAVDKRLQLKSLAIPAIGTGQIGMSSSDVAKKFRKTIDAFKTTDPKNLTKIDIVVFDGRMVNDFKKAFSGSAVHSLQHTSTRTTPTSLASTSSSSRLQPQLPVQVSVVPGDILTSNCEVMVNTTGSDYNLTSSQLSAKVIQKGGNRIATECQSPQNHSANHYRVTSGGKMHFKHIVHYVTPNNGAHLTKGLEDVFVLVNDKLKKSSLAVPAIGTGNAQLPVAVVVQAMETAINNFIKRNPKVLTRIEIVVFDPSIISHFQTQMSNISVSVSQSTSTGFTTRPKPRDSPLRHVPSAREVNEQHSIVIFLTSNKSSKRNEAWQAICDKADSKCKKRPIENDVLEMLDKDDLNEIMALENKHGVCIRRPDDTKETNKLLILGLDNKVMDAYADALTLLHKYNQAVTYAEFVDWKFKNKISGKWESFSLLTNAKLEMSYKESPKGKLKVETKIRGVLVPVIVDFHSDTMKRLDDQSTCDIRKHSISSVDRQFPSNWVNNKPLQLVTLATGTGEYQIVLQKFQATSQGTIGTVVRIERVENRRLFLQFQAQKNEVEERMKSKTVTKELFHGTPTDICDQIYKSGFNRSFAGKNAALYGKGVYFATDSSYSHGYTQPIAMAPTIANRRQRNNMNFGFNTQGERKMFLADVVIGEYCQGNQSYIVPPQRPGGGSSDLYDSVVDNVPNPSIYVVFKDASVYPLYILTYT